MQPERTHHFKTTSAICAESRIQWLHNAMGFLLSVKLRMKNNPVDRQKWGALQDFLRETEEAFQQYLSSVANGRLSEPETYTAFLEQIEPELRRCMKRIA